MFSNTDQDRFSPQYLPHVDAAFALVLVLHVEEEDARHLGLELAEGAGVVLVALPMRELQVPLEHVARLCAERARRAAQQRLHAERLVLLRDRHLRHLRGIHEVDLLLTGSASVEVETSLGKFALFADGMQSGKPHLPAEQRREQHRASTLIGVGSNVRLQTHFPQREVTEIQVQKLFSGLQNRH